MLLLIGYLYSVTPRIISFNQITRKNKFSATNYTLASLFSTRLAMWKEKH